MKWASALIGAVLYVATFASKPSDVQTVVALELVLAVDTSSSVNGTEYALQLQGIATAFRSPEVIELIEHSGGVAVTLIQWSSWAEPVGALPWRLLTDKASVLSFAAEVERTKRASVGRLTGIGTAIRAGLRALEENRFTGTRQKIDVSGDGQTNTGLPLEQARKLARSKGVTVNGLAIENDVPELAKYFRDQIISGPDAFVVAAADYPDFARAMQTKLLRELAPKISRGPEPVCVPETAKCGGMHPYRGQPASAAALDAPTRSDGPRYR